MNEPRKEREGGEGSKILHEVLTFSFASFVLIA
jgi:hypothetical protein